MAKEEVFRAAHMHKGKSGSYLLDVNGGEKVALVSDFIPGKRPAIKNTAHAELMGKAMAAFHESFPSQVSSTDGSILNVAEEYIGNIKKTYSKELTDKMRASGNAVFIKRADFFDHACQYIDDNSSLIKAQVEMLPSLKGVTHGGLHQENMILTEDNKIALIDIDTLKREGDQWRDIIYAGTRLSLSKNKEPFDIFVNNYMNVRSLPAPVKEKSNEAVGALKTLIGLNSLYASLYHHKSVFVDQAIDLNKFISRRSEVAKDFDDNAEFISSELGSFRSAQSNVAKEKDISGYQERLREEKSRAGASQSRTLR